jgi:hypothetical protein
VNTTVQAVNTTVQSVNTTVQAVNNTVQAVNTTVQSVNNTETLTGGKGESGRGGLHICMFHECSCDRVLGILFDSPKFAEV